MRKRKPMPMPQTLNDLVLLGQMGYEIPFGDGVPISIRKRNALEKLKDKIKSSLSL